MYKILHLPTGNIVNKFKDADDNYPFNNKNYTLDYHIDHIHEFDLVEVKKFFVVLAEWNMKGGNILHCHFQVEEVDDEM
jgi:hypothetical protein